jgi:DNA modification methylase
VQLFREVRRVLRKDGTLWVNLGDSYANDAKGPRGSDTSTLGDGGKSERLQYLNEQKGWRGSLLGIKKKDLIGIPWAVAFALRADGWYLRRDIVWDKPNPKPESALDRPSTAHEYLFLFSKRASYYYDNVAVREYATTGNHPHRNATGPEPSHVPMCVATHRPTKTAGPGAGRNCRSVWRIQVRPYKEAHFATFPEELPARCIRAGSSEHGGCAHLRRAVPPAGAQGRLEPDAAGDRRRQRQRRIPRRRHQGVRRRPRREPQRPEAPHPRRDARARHGRLGADVPLPQRSRRCRVACSTRSPDPAPPAPQRSGSGATFTGIELNPDYIDMAERRLTKAAEPPRPKRVKVEPRLEVDEPLPFEVPA